MNQRPDPRHPCRASLQAALAACALGLMSSPAAGVAAPPTPPQASPANAQLPIPPPSPEATVGDQGAGGQPRAVECTGCHSKLSQGRIVHGALQNYECTECHRAVASEAGRCGSRAASKWALAKTEPELCYGCHDRKDGTPSVHTAIRQGGCLSCHAAHSSKEAGLLAQPREKLCLDCHDADALSPKPVKHAPVREGRCLDCHDPHGGKFPKNLRVQIGSAFCLRCHDAKAATGKGTPGARYRVDLGKKVVHGALEQTDCLGCHESGHGSDNLKLLKKRPADLCSECHERKDRSSFPHGAVLAGDCAVCHDPHSSDAPKLLAKPTIQQTCFLCHQDDLTGRKTVHAPVQKGCDQCHDPHGAQNRFALKGGDGKAVCYACHQPVDAGKVKHAALERYGCTVCHDPHGTDWSAMLPRAVNEVCARCHPDQRDGAHVVGNSGRPHPVGGELNDPRREGRDFSCASCHAPHGSDNPKLFYFGATAMESCSGCHGDKSGSHPELNDIVSRARRKPRAQTGGGAGARVEDRRVDGGGR